MMDVDRLNELEAIDPPVGEEVSAEDLAALEAMTLTLFQPLILKTVQKAREIAKEE